MDKREQNEIMDGGDGDAEMGCPVPVQPSRYRTAILGTTAEIANKYNIPFDDIKDKVLIVSVKIRDSKPGVVPGQTYIMTTTAELADAYGIPYEDIKDKVAVVSVKICDSMPGVGPGQTLIINDKIPFAPGAGPPNAARVALPSGPIVPTSSTTAAAAAVAVPKKPAYKTPVVGKRTCFRCRKRKVLAEFERKPEEWGIFVYCRACREKASAQK